MEQYIQAREDRLIFVGISNSLRQFILSTALKESNAKTYQVSLYQDTASYIFTESNPRLLSSVLEFCKINHIKVI